MSGTLFAPAIQGWDDWEDVYQDRQAFLPLVRAIYAREGLPAPQALGALTPGTNAVFRAGDTVVKVFAPVEAGFDASRDFAVEVAMLRHIKALGIETSDLLAVGALDDRYRFRYMILRYVHAQEAGMRLAGLPTQRRVAFARRMRALCERLHRPSVDLLPPVDLKARATTNERLDALPESLRESMRSRCEGLTWDAECIVHGDLTGENVLMDASDMPVLIDFADAASAPSCYELPPLVFELFHSERDLVRGYLAGDDLAAFIAALLDGLSLHDFGAYIIRDYIEREGLDPQSLPTLHALGEHLRARWT